MHGNEAFLVDNEVVSPLQPAIWLVIGIELMVDIDALKLDSAIVDSINL